MAPASMLSSSQRRTTSSGWAVEDDAADGRAVAGSVEDSPADGGVDPVADVVPGLVTAWPDPTENTSTPLVVCPSSVASTRQITP
jgi:hypothetical protein